jgi:hypothetical protein
MKVDSSSRDREIRLFEHRYPSVRLQPIQLNSLSKTALSMAYADKIIGNEYTPWWALRRKRLEVDEEMRVDIDAVSLSQATSSSQLRIRQSTEEEVLNAGLEAVVEKGATPMQAPRPGVTTDNTLLRFGPQEKRRKERKL